MNEANDQARARELDKTTALYNAATDYAAYVNSNKHDYDEAMKLSDALEAAAVAYAELAGDRQPVMTQTPAISTLASSNGSARPSKCPQCGEPIIQTNLGGGKTDDYCEDCGWPDENRVEKPQGEIRVTYEQLETVLKECRSRIESAPGEPPDGYDVDNEELTKVADASWEAGMKQMETAILNWAYDQVKAPNVKSSHSRD